MELIKWTNGKGQTLSLTPEEAEELLKALEEAIYTRLYEGENFTVELEL